jgi:hypothetical protein
VTYVPHNLLDLPSKLYISFFKINIENISSWEEEEARTVGRRKDISQADMEIMVELGNLVPSQNPRVAAIFKENSCIMYTYICLQELVNLHLSAATCIPTSVCRNLYTYTCLQKLVYLHLSAETCIHIPVCSNLYTYICLQKLVYIYLSAAYTTDGCI